MRNNKYQEIRRCCWAIFTLLVFFACLPAACKKNEPLPEDVQNLGRATGPVSPKPARSGARVPGKAPIYQGIVQETIEVSRYTYIRMLDTSGKEIWAAVPQTKIENGSRVRVAQSIVMQDFKSPGLGRTFPMVVFGVLEETGEGDAGAVSPEKAQKLPPGHPPIE